MTAFTDEIRDTVSPHKFGGDKMAAALWLLSLESGQDEETRDACDWLCWVARFGRRLLVVDSPGFVYCWKYKTEAEAVEEFDAIDNDYNREETTDA